jgi:hypothetical protein
MRRGRLENGCIDYNMSETAPLTFEAYDKLGLKPFSEKLERYLMVTEEKIRALKVGDEVLISSVVFTGG